MGTKSYRSVLVGSRCFHLSFARLCLTIIFVIATLNVAVAEETKSDLPFGLSYGDVASFGVSFVLGRIEQQKAQTNVANILSAIDSVRRQMEALTGLTCNIYKNGDDIALSALKEKIDSYFTATDKAARLTELTLYKDQTITIKNRFTLPNELQPCGLSKWDAFPQYMALAAVDIYLRSEYERVLALNDPAKAYVETQKQTALVVNAALAHIKDLDANFKNPNTGLMTTMGGWRYYTDSLFNIQDNGPSLTSHPDEYRFCQYQGYRTIKANKITAVIWTESAHSKASTSPPCYGSTKTKFPYYRSVSVFDAKGAFVPNNALDFVFGYTPGMLLSADASELFDKHVRLNYSDVYRPSSNYLLPKDSWFLTAAEDDILNRYKSEIYNQIAKTVFRPYASVLKEWIASVDPLIVTKPIYPSPLTVDTDIQKYSDAFLYADSDQDGLTDIDEGKLFHTNRGTGDSDGDGISDSYEVTHVGLDPNFFGDGQKDLDSDGYTNYQEYLAGSDATNAQSNPKTALAAKLVPIVDLILN